MTPESRSEKLLTSEKIDGWARNLSRLEDIRAGVGAEAFRKPAVQKYIQVILSAGKMFKEIEKEKPIEETLLIQLGTALFCATTYESLAKHASVPSPLKEFLLDKAQNWSDKLDKISEDIHSDKTIHGSPIAWKLETARVMAGLHERRTKNRKDNLFEAARLYRKALEIGKEKANSNDESVRHYATGASGVALGELARVQDVLVHDFGSNEFSEQEIKGRYKESAELMWKLFNTKAENWDRIDTVFGRFLEYCHGHGETPPLQLFVNWKQLVDKYKKELRPRMIERIKTGLIPDEDIQLFQ